MQKRLVILALLTMGAIAGCATEGTSIPIGEQRFAPTDPVSLVLLTSEPSRAHTVVAMVEGVAATDDYFGSEAKTQAAAVQAMRKEAARLGAHAVVLSGKSSEASAAITTGNGIVSGGYFTATATTMGFQKIRVAGKAIRYAE